MSARRTPAIVFLPLMAPYGIAAGFVSVTLAWRLQAAGLSAGIIASLVALSIWPNTWKVLWAPLVDTTLGLKRWHAIGTTLTAVSLVLLGLLSPTLANYRWLAALIVISTVTSTVQASGGAQNLWAAIAGDWHASADQVALVNGAVGGIASLIGALIGGWLCDRIDRRLAYCLFGLAVAAAAGVMALLPRSSDVFIAMTLSYAFALGACYAAYSAVVLEAIGREAAATKFQLLAAASNVPIALMTTWDGRLHDWKGASGMLAGEVIFCVAGIMLFATIVSISRRLEARQSRRLV